MDRKEYESMAQLEDLHFWFRARRVILKEVLRRRIVNSRSDDFVILDAGCGTGGNLQWLADYGHVVGLDSDSLASSISNKKSTCNVVQGLLPNGLPFKKEIFDLVTMFDVLEHIDDDLGALSQIREYLKPEGKVLLTVPAFRHLWSNHDIIHHHKRRYLKGQLSKTLLKSGFRVEYLSYYNTILYPLIALVRFKNKLLSEEKESDMNKTNHVLNQFLYKLFSFERNWIGRFEMPFGVSLVAVAHRDY